jgi:N4-gp56 family major capsid protein
MAITTTSTLPAPVQQSFDYMLLSVPVPNMIHSIPAMRKRMPKHGGTTLRMRRYNPLNVALVPLGNTGVTPPAQQLTALDIDAKISWYGSYVLINEQVTIQNQDPVLNEAATRLGVSLRQTEDQLISSMLASTASVLNCVNGTDGDNPTEITQPDISNAYRQLMNNNGYTFTQSIGGEDQFGTAPVRNAYFGLGSSQILSDLERTQGFLNVAQYPGNYNALDCEWGSVGNVRWLLSSIGSFTPNASNLGANVFNNFICAVEAYATIYQDGNSSQFLFTPQTIAGGPLQLNSAIGWKMAMCPRITNDLWVLNLRSTVTQ